MLDHGHPNADIYPVGMVWEETQLVVERLNREYASTASVMRSVMRAAVASFGKKSGEANKALTDMIKELHGDG